MILTATKRSNGTRSSIGDSGPNKIIYQYSFSSMTGSVSIGNDSDNPFPPGSVTIAFSPSPQPFLKRSTTKVVKNIGAFQGGFFNKRHTSAALSLSLKEPSWIQPLLSYLVT